MGDDILNNKNMSTKLIQMYGDRPLLWNPRDPYYRVTSMKVEAWQEVADEFGVEVVPLRKKLNSLLASYRRERMRVRKGRRSVWFLYDLMNFMPNYVPNNTSDVGDATVEFVNEDDLEDDETQITFDEEDNESVQYFDIPNQDIFVKEEVEVDIPKPKKMKTIYVRPDKPRPERTETHTKYIKVPMERNEYIESTHEIVNPIENIVYKTPNEERDKKDECDVFGEYIAKSLRKHDDKTRAMIKQAINNVIYEEEMRKYDTDSNVVSSGNN